jgi:translation initiation factor 3 subunit A
LTPKCATQDAALDDIEDLENDRSPDDLLLSIATSGASGASTSREALLPWVRYAWDTMRSVLETLRRAPKLERVYHDLSVQCMGFLAQYNRANEFRRLCTSMRYHLQDYRKLTEETGGWSADALERNLKTRFIQLTNCANLGLWSEAFRTIETIYEILSISGIEPPIRLMAEYYDRLASIFWESGDHLFHAYANLRRFTVCDTADKAASCASRAVIAALCVPRFSSTGSDAIEGDTDRESKTRLAALLSLPAAPTRTELLAELRARGLVDLASPPARRLFFLLTEGFTPLTLSEEAADAIALLTDSDDSLALYRPILAQQAALRHVEQLGSAYSSITLGKLFQHLSPLGLERHPTEQLIVSAVRARHLNLHIDHRTGCLHYAEGSVDSGSLRTHLAVLTRRLRNAVSMAIREESKDSVAAAAATPALSQDGKVALAAGETLRDPERRVDTFNAARKAMVPLFNATVTRREAISDFRDSLGKAKAAAEFKVSDRALDSPRKAAAAPRRICPVSRWPPLNPCHNNPGQSLSGTEPFLRRFAYIGPHTLLLVAG